MSSLAQWKTPGGLPPPNAGQVGTKATVPGADLELCIQNHHHSKKKEDFGSPKDKLSSSLIENYHRDRLFFSPHLAIF